jgi:hypothetical protein
MSTPIVTEIVSRPEPVAHDPFIDDLRSSAGASNASSASAASRPTAAPAR